MFVVKSVTIRTILSLALSRQWPIHQLKNTLLKRLKQAPQAWFQQFAFYATRFGFSHSKCDTSLFIFRRGNNIAYLLLYLDDIVLSASSIGLLQRIIASLHMECSMIDLGPLKYFGGISVTRTAMGMFLCQSKYAIDILTRARMLNCNACETPVDIDNKLGSFGLPVVNPTTYRNIVTALQDLTFTRPDLTYVVQQCCLHMHDPRTPHLAALKRILRYLRGTLDHGLQLYASRSSILTAYSDADWRGCPDTGKSNSGYCVFLGSNLLSWSSKRQAIISSSSAQAEYRGVANVVAQISWIRNLLRELHAPTHSATIVYCDHVSVVQLTSNHVDFVQDQIFTGQVRLLHVRSHYQFAEIFTKGLPTTLFLDFKSNLSVQRPPAKTMRVY